MSREVVTTENAPGAAAPYSQAIVANGFVFTAGQVPLDPTTNKLVESDDIKVHTRRVLDNIKAVLDAAGTSLENVVKVTVFLADINDFAEMNSAYAEYFPESPPARSAFQVAQLPLGARIEIETIAIKE